MTLNAKIREHLNAENAEDMLVQYLDEGTFSGAWFERLGGRGDDPAVANRFTPADLIAVSTLSVRISGWAAIRLLEDKADELTALLKAIQTDLPLHEATDGDIEAVYAAHDALNGIRDIGHVTRSKLLARKRPHLVPIRDQHVLRDLVGSAYGPFTQPLRDVLAADEGVLNRLEELRKDREGLSLLRILDIVVWMRTHGAASVE